MKKKCLIISMLIIMISTLVYSQITLEPGVTRAIQAEDAFLSQAVIESEHTGYTGSGYVNFDNGPGSYLEWTVSVPSDGPADCELVFANGSGNRPMDVAVNGSVVASNPFQGTGGWTTWTPAGVTINLSAGNNTIRITSSGAEGGPNMDRMDITFNGQGPQTGVTGDVNNDKTIDIVDALLVAQFYVDLNPNPFHENLGDVNCDDIIDIIDALLIAQFYVELIDAFEICGTPEPPPTPVVTPTAVVTPAPTGVSGPTADPSVLVGWATQGGGTTGGGNASPITVTSLSELNSQAGGSSAKVIYVDGQFSGKLTVGSNKTIIGLPGARISGSSALSIGSSSNVIIKNIHFQGTPDGGSDTANIDGGHNIWVDHCTFVDGGDGMFDMVHGANYITISWCKMYYTKQTGHQNAMLLGHSDGNSGEDSGKIKVTFHHNWWSENIAERQPRVRFGQVHIFNNLYVATQGFTCYAIRAAYKANVRSERNIFIDFSGQSKAASDAKHEYGECLAFNYAFNKNDSTLQTIEDVFINCTDRGIDADDVEGGTFGNGTAFTPPYNYTADSTVALEAVIRAEAGAK